MEHDTIGTQSAEELNIPNSSLDLLEQHQAREQARLLQRFRELREWQQLQQQQLMLQQQQQLRSLQDEQSKVQTYIASQGSKAVKPSMGGSLSPLMTPPTKPRSSQTTNLVADSVSQSQMAAISMDSGLVVSMQDTLKSQSSLPRPVMYQQQNPGGKDDHNDDDKYTTSELFSNLGSQDELQESIRDVMGEDDDRSESSSNVLRGSLLPPPVKAAIKGGNQLAGLEQLLSTAPAGLLQKMLGLLPGGAGDKGGAKGRRSEDIELSASPMLPAQGLQQPVVRRLLDYDQNHNNNNINNKQVFYAETNGDLGSSHDFDKLRKHRINQDQQQQYKVNDSQHDQQGSKDFQQQQQQHHQQRSKDHHQQQQQQQRSKDHYQHQQHHQQRSKDFQQQQHHLQQRSKDHYQQQQQQMVDANPQVSQHKQQVLRNDLSILGSKPYFFLDSQLGPSPSESDVDPSLVPRAVTLRDCDSDIGQTVGRVVSHKGGRWCEDQQGADDDDNDDQFIDDNDEEDYYDDDEDMSALQKAQNDEDRPISGTGGKKSFEELIEEQLRQEQQKHQHQGKATGSSGRKANFLKKGDGIARFNSAPKKPPPKRRTATKSARRTFHPGDVAGPSGSGSGEHPVERMRKVQPARREEASRKSSVGLRLKNSNKPPAAAVRGVNKGQGYEEKDDESSAKLSLIRNAASRKIEEQHKQMEKEQQEYKQMEKEQQEYQQQQLQQYLQQQQQSQVRDSGDQLFFRGGPRKVGDLSTIIEQSPSLEGRSTVSEDHDSTELDSLAEFEVLEEAADNMSMCSSSSLVGRLLYGDKQGQKEAVHKLKTITESLKSARSDTSGGDHSEQAEELPGGLSNRNNNNIDVDIDHYQKGENKMVAVDALKGLNHDSRDREKTSSDETLTDSSEDEDDGDDVGVQMKRGPIVVHESNSHTNRVGDRSDTLDVNTNPNLATGKDMPRSSSSSSISSLSSSNSITAMTRKVAPMSSKFSAATDTLSLLKSLSAQANLISSTTQAIPVSSSQHIGSEPTQPTSSGLKFLPGTNTLPSNFFSNAAKDGELLVSTYSRGAETSGSMMSGLPFGTNSQVTGDSAATLVGKEDNYSSGKYASSDNGEDHIDSDEDDDKGDDSDSKIVTKTGSENQSGKGAQELNQQVSAFDDESAWEDEEDDDAFDGASTLKHSGKSEKSSEQQQKQTEPSTPPTSRLVSRLFPKLKPKPSQETERNHQSLQEASSQPLTTTAGIQSGVLREKLKELDMEIERFRSENANLEKLRRDREEGLAKLKQEIGNFQKEKETELKRLEEFKTEEMKKLRREKKLFESYQKKVRSMPDKREREEIENLKAQLEEVQDELKRKESRWTASSARLKNRVAELELENGELKEEVRILERKRLDWMTSGQGGNTSRGGAAAVKGKSGGPSSIGGTSVTSRVPGQSGPRSSTPTGDLDKPAAGPQSKGLKKPNLTSKATNGRSNNTNYSNRGKNSVTASNSNHTNTKITNGDRGDVDSNKKSEVGGGSNTSNGASQAWGPAVIGPNSSHPNGQPGSTASVVAPTIPVTTLAPQASASQPQQSSSTRDSGESLGQTMQRQTVPVMAECTIPSGTQMSSMPGLQPEPGSEVNKSAARMAIERASVDKGDATVFTETRHQDGKVEKVFQTGAREIHFPNGTVKEISADDQTIVCRLANGDIRQIFPDHRVVYIFAKAQIMQTTFPDGLETFQFQNGQVERRYPDGTVEITFPSKDIKYLFPDGGQEVILTDGTVMQYNTKGERTVEYPSGDREVHTAEFQRREFPDGIIKTIYADGRHETRFPNGRVRMRDKEGTIILDQIVHR